ncbi:MAG: alpha/beta hydrolase [Holophaga sp.]|nr:alpha/beta hydrolase [Holophaga sp.]
MRPQIQWSGTGQPVLLFPGWNTQAGSVYSWLPASFRENHRCGILEWPGLGKAEDELLPEDLDSFLDNLVEALPLNPIPIVGFCMGGIAAWAFAQRHPRLVSALFLVETPLSFPAILGPLLAPGLGGVVLGLAKDTTWGRFLVRRAILQATIRYSESFLQELFDFKRKAALHYLRLFYAYNKALGHNKQTRPATCPCWQLVGQNPIRALAPYWGPRQQVESTVLTLDGAGHFPAVETPAVFFEHLERLLAGL